MATPKKKTNEKTNERTTKSPSSFEATEKKILAKLDELNADLEQIKADVELLAEQTVLAQKVLSEDLGVDLRRAADNLREQLGDPQQR